MTVDLQALKAFIESDVAIIVGACSSDCTPSIVRGWAAQLDAGGTLQFFVSRAASPSTVANLLSNPAVSITLSHPSSFRTVQVKGRCTDIRTPEEWEQERIQRYQEAFLDTVSQYGLKREAIINIWGPDPVRLTVNPEFVFDQTPGPGAGRPL